MACFGRMRLALFMLSPRRQLRSPVVEASRTGTTENVMMKPHWVMGLALVLLASPANAQVVQVTRADARHSIGFNLGYFSLKGEDARDVDDVLLADQADLALRDRPESKLEIGDLNNITFGGEWLYAPSNFLETGVSIGFYQKKAATQYKDLVNTNGTDIEQDLKLRVVPITATVRFLPLGRDHAIEPFVGAGIGFFPWRYSEIGQFVDGNNDIFNGRFIDSGTAVGPVIVGGLRFPIGDALTAGAELRWQHAKGDLKTEGFLSNTIDLGGLNAAFSVNFRF